MKWTRPKAILIAAALWAGIYLPGLGQMEFRGEEGRRVLPAVTMLQGPGTLANWLVPQVAGEKYFNKPPGINWIVAASFAATGRQNEFTARLPSALSVLFLALLLIGMNSTFLDVPARLTAAALFMASPVMIIKGRSIEIDAIYTCITGMAILWWLNQFAHGGRPWRQWIVPGLLLAVGSLIKGPFLAVPYYAVVICVLLYARQWRQLLRLPHLVSAAVVLVVGLGWLILVRRLAGAELVSQTIEGQFTARVQEISPVRWLAEVGQSLGHFAPWVFMLPILWMKSFVARIPEPHRPLFRGCRLGMVLGYAGLCLVPGLLWRYTMPALPTAAILLGWLVSRPRPALATDRLWRALELAAAPALLGACAVIGIKLGWTSTLIAAMAAIGASALVLWILRARLEGGVNLTLGTTVLAVLAVLLIVQFQAALWPQGQKRRAEAALVNQAVPPGQTLYIFNPGYQRFLIFLRGPVQYLMTPDQMDPNVRYLLYASEPRMEVKKPLVQDLRAELTKYRTAVLCEFTQPASKHEKKQIFQVLECLPGAPETAAASEEAAKQQ